MEDDTITEVSRTSRVDNIPRNSIPFWYYDPVALFASSLRDPEYMKYFSYYPQKVYSKEGTRIYNEMVSADWFDLAFRNSPATTVDGVLKPGCLFVGIIQFDDGSPIDKLMKSSEHPFLMSTMNLSLEGRKLASSWSLVSLLPDIEVSDLEKASGNQKSNGNLSLRRLQLYHHCTELINQPFKDPEQFYNLWVHGLGYTKVYFQIGCIVGDTEQHNKICGFRAGNGLYRLHICRNCDAPTYDADIPSLKCNPKCADKTKAFLSWALDESIELPPLDGHDVSPSHPNHPTVDDWCKVISQKAVMPSLLHHHFGGDIHGVFGATPFEALHQFQLGLVEKILASLFNYKRIPDKFRDWLDTRKSPAYPEGTSQINNKPSPSLLSMSRIGKSKNDNPKKRIFLDLSSSEIDSDKEVHRSNGGSNDEEEAPSSDDDDHLFDVDNRTQHVKYLHWMKLRPKNIRSKSDVFNRVMFENAARFISSCLERQSDRSIPHLSHRAGLTALSKMSGQEFPGLCLLTILSMGGMMGNHDLEKDFTTLLWLCISMNDILHSPIFSSDCIEILETRIQRFLQVTRLVIGDQREFASKAGLRIAKFHGMQHYPQMIRKFGMPLNFWGGHS